MIDFLLYIDEEAFLFINSVNHYILDPMVKVFSGQYIWALMYATIAWAVCWRYGWRRGLLLVGVTLLSIGFADVLCSQVIRPLVGRLRPANLDNPISIMVHIVDGYRGGMYGFPSCHATNTFALAVATSMLLKSRLYTAFIFIWAILQCYSRIYLGVHYPGDIIVGALIGSAIAYCVMRLTFSKLQLNDYEGSNTKFCTLPIYIAFAITVILTAVLA